MGRYICHNIENNQIAIRKDSCFIIKLIYVGNCKYLTLQQMQQGLHHFNMQAQSNAFVFVRLILNPYHCKYNKYFP